MRTKQELFDIIVAHLRKQGRKSIANNAKTIETTCLYRGPDGTKCAIGCLIPDELYKPIMETKSMAYIVCYIENAELANELATHQCILSPLQKIHDNQQVSDWESSWMNLAARYGLKYTPPSET